MLHVLAIHAQLNKLDFISISLLLHNPLKGITTWLGRISLGLTWTLLPNDLLDLHKIYGNLLHHRSNDLSTLLCAQSQSLFGVQLNIWAQNYFSLWLFHNCHFRSWGCWQSKKDKIPDWPEQCLNLSTFTKDKWQTSWRSIFYPSPRDKSAT